MKRFFGIVLSLFASFLPLTAQEPQQNYTLLSPQEFNKSISRPDVQLIDVRSQSEFAENHLAGAKCIDIRDTVRFDSLTQTLSKEQPVYLYCRSGKRSKTAALRLIKKGYQVYDMKGGILAWKEVDLPVVTE